MATTPGYKLSPPGSKRAQNAICAVLEALATRSGGFITLERAKHSITPRGTLILAHINKHAARFKLRWKDGTHYVGYLLDSEGGESQAVCSLYTPYDASMFAIAYTLLVEVRAKVWKTSEPLFNAGVFDHHRQSLIEQRTAGETR